MNKKVAIECCEIFEVYDKNIHCQHLHFFSGVASYAHKKCCTHTACVRVRNGDKK